MSFSLRNKIAADVVTVPQDVLLKIQNGFNLLPMSVSKFSAGKHFISGNTILSTTSPKRTKWEHQEEFTPKATRLKILSWIPIRKTPSVKKPLNYLLIVIKTVPEAQFVENYNLERP